MKLSQHFALEEMIRSDTARERGIDNTPSTAVLAELQKTAELLERVRVLLGNRPIEITSGYRSPALNAVLPGASLTSAHMWGGAADFVCPGYGPPLTICRDLASYAASLRFDQIIQEGTWVHIGRAPAGQEPRLELLTADGHGGYRRGL